MDDGPPRLGYTKNIPMKHTFRFFIFITFCLSFVAITSGVLLYVYGYRFSVERGIFIYSGSITIKTTPQEVTIFIDGVEVPPNKTGILNQSYLISGLLPGKHYVEVKAEGYHPWAKDVIVQSGLSTEFWNVFLVEQNIGKNNQDHSAETRQMYPAPKDPTLIVFAQENAEGVKIVLADTEENDQEQDTIAELPGYQLLPATEKENVEWSPNERYLLIPVLKDGVRDTAFVQIKDEKVTMVSAITGKTGLHHLRWNPDEKTQVFYREGNTLLQTDLKDEELEYMTRLEDIVAYDLSQDYLFYLKSNGHVYRVNIDAADEAAAIQVTKETIAIQPEDRHTLIAYNQTRFTLQNDTTGELWLYNRFGAEIFYKRILDADAKGSQFSNDGKKLLYYTDSQAFVYYLRDWKVQPNRSRGDIQPLIRLANNLKYPQWSFDYEHVLYVVDGSVKIIELDNREAQYIQDIVHFTDPITQVLPRFNENRVYFLLAPQNGNSFVQSIEFPKEELTFIDNFLP